MQYLKLLKIEHGLDTITKCQCCKKDLKLVYWTEEGPLGQNCFLTRIGLPRTRSQKMVILPTECYEAMAEEVIKKLSNISDQEMVAYFTSESWSRNKAIHFYRQGLYFHIQYYENGYQSNKGDLLSFYNDFPLTHFAGISSQLWEQIKKTKAISAYYRETRIPEQFLNLRKVF